MSFLAHHSGQTRNNINLLVGVYSKHRQLVRQVGAFTRPDINIRPQMASHGISWVLSAHVRFRDLDFIITVEGEMAWAPVVVQPFHSASLDTVTETLGEL